MKIALFGYGKMGRIIEKYAIERGHDVVLIIDENNYSDIEIVDLQTADVAIDFSTPNSILKNISLCFEADLPLIVGTTGWYDEIETIRERCLAGNHSLLYGSNFSVGVNIFFHVNRLLAEAMRPHHQYEVQVEEIHHTAKLDAPSGTAITIAEGVLENSDNKTDWVNYIVEEEKEVIPKANQLLIESHRIEDVPGTHTVLYSSEVDQIEFKHTAHSRAGFALGALIAAEWLQDKKGFFNVTEMFTFGHSDNNLK